MIKINKKASLFTYTFSHFCVDFACFFMLFYGFGNHVESLETLALGFLIYNVTAFGLQPVIGYFCDMKRGVPVALIGCCILVSGLALLYFSWVSLFICALGNACFHVGGGIDSLVNANGKMSRSGVFVSSGALGVSLGTLAGKNGNISIMVPVLLLVFSIIFLVRFTVSRNPEQADVHFNITSVNKPVSLVLALCFVMVIIRSYVGSVIPMTWRTTIAFMLLPGIGAFIGKAAGGFLADRFGARNVGVLTLLISLPLLCFGYHNPLLCTIGILFFNMTMPIMLCVIGDKLPGNPGFAFGLTTLWLLCGNIPTFFFLLPNNIVVLSIGILILVSAVCIHIVTINQKGVFRYEKNSQTA